MSATDETPALQIIRARVGKVREDGIIVTYPIRTMGELNVTTDITFHLSVWGGNNQPRPGQIVELEGVALFMKGWRANSARPILPNGNRKS